ncbi:MAG: AarF/ABC1/UbiB kinase family protein [Planctomycetaceae bacterium]|nr:AarF/ABC1/UbiB kinase family protein [Planctomycetaceae bacterium]
METSVSSAPDSFRREFDVKITTIPQIYRNVNRMTEIVSVLSKYGLADGISRLNVDFAKGLLKNRDGEALARHTRETRIRLAMEELGPTFIKLGQILSTRADLVGATLANELRSLQDSVSIDDPEEVRRVVQDELGQPIEDLFIEFDDCPTASASIGQVHRARLKTGELVAVKVQHAGIQDTVRKDLDVLGGLAQLAERLPELAPYRPVETIAEFQRTLRRELDFGREERNLNQFSARFQDNPYIRIPRPITELSTPRVLTMEWLTGLKLNDTNSSLDDSYDMPELSRRGADLYMQMIFVEGFFHADPHPGNILILPGNKIGLLDFGMVGRIDERLREEIEDLLMAIVNGDVALLTSLIVRIGSTPADLDQSALQNELADFVSHYGSQSLSQLDLSGALEEMIELIFRFRIVLPAQVAMLLKVLISLEGSAKLLSPEFSLLEVIQRYQKKAILRRLSPTRRIRKLRRLYVEIEHLLETLPSRVTDIFEQVQAGRFDVHLDHRGLEPSVNRLVLGMLASALFMGSSLMLSRSVPPVLFETKTVFGLHEVSLLGLGGCMLSLLLGLRLLRAIGKSGRLDRRQ